MPLTTAGFVAPTGAEHRAEMIADYEQITGLTLDTTRDDDQVTMVFIDILAARLGAVSELQQAAFDGGNAEAAVGIQAQDAAFFVGVEPDAATYSQATVTLSGTTGVTVPEGSLVEGGGENDDARWYTSEPATFVAGTVDVVVVAQIAGPTTAEAGDIDKIVTAVTGWDSVTNAAAATPGSLRETDSELRRRRRTALPARASCSRAAILASLVALDYITEAKVIENSDNATQTVSGKSMDPNSVWVFLNPSTLTEAQKTEIAATLHKKVAAGTKLLGSDETKVATDVGGSTGRSISWDYGEDVAVAVGVTIDLAPGVLLADVSPGIIEALVDYVNDGIGMGGTLSEFQAQTALVHAGIEGLEEADVSAAIVSPRAACRSRTRPRLTST